MPSTSAKQHRFMEAIAHSPSFAKKVGVPQSVGKDYSSADKGKKFGIGGSATYTEGGENQINKQQTRRGSTFGSQKGMPNVNLNKYIGKKEGGIMKSDMKEDMKMDKKQDVAMIKKAFKEHDSQEHKGGKGTKLALKKGGDVKKMAKGGMSSMKETMGPKNMGKDVEAGSNKLTKFGESAVQKRGKTKGMEPTMPKFARGGGIEQRGKTKGRMC